MGGGEAVIVAAIRLPDVKTVSVPSPQLVTARDLELLHLPDARAVGCRPMKPWRFGGVRSDLSGAIANESLEI